jgi:hypothetical protein
MSNFSTQHLSDSQHLAVREVNAIESQESDSMEPLTNMQLSAKGERIQPFTPHSSRANDSFECNSCKKECNCYA